MGNWWDVPRIVKPRGRQMLRRSRNLARRYALQAILFVGVISFVSLPRPSASAVDLAFSTSADAALVDLYTFGEEGRSLANMTASARGGQRPDSAQGPDGEPALARAPQDNLATRGEAALAARTQYYETLSRQLISEPEARLDNTSYRNIFADEAFGFCDGRAEAKMTLDEVRAFLTRRAPALARYDDGSGRSVADSVYRAAQRSDVNPMLLLAKLQVEQSLLDASVLSQNRMDWALGVSVDGWSRHEGFRGFSAQVNGAARTLAKLFAEGRRLVFPVRFPWAVNDAPDNLFRHTLPTRLTVDNAATYALFRYTPHTVSSGSRTNPGGGNYLLVRVFVNLFGPQALAGVSYSSTQGG